MAARRALVFSALVLAFALGCKRPPKGGVTSRDGGVTLTAATTTANGSPSAAVDEVPFGVTPSWPAPKLSPDEPVVLRVARTMGKDVLWAYGGKGAKGIAVSVRWRDASGIVVASTSMTGGMFTPTDGWWRYTFAPTKPSYQKHAAEAVTVEAQAYELLYENGKKWMSPTFIEWRQPHAKPTTTDKGIGVEVTAIEREYFLDDLQGRVYVEIYNQSEKKLKRVDLDCSVNDRNGSPITTGLHTSWIPVTGDHPHPALLPGEHVQLRVEHSIKTEADRAAWAQPGLGASCRIEKTAPL